MEEVALTAWHGQGRTTTKREIEARCTKAKLDKQIPLFTKGAEHSVAQLFTAFYFRRHGQNGQGEPTFEFTHKSFGEYLTALRIVRTLRRIHEETKAQKANGDSGWDERQALDHWVDHCGRAAMDGYLLRALKNEVELIHRMQSETVAAWQQVILEMIRVCLADGMPLEKLDPRPSYETERKFARNAGEALLAAHCACAEQTGKQGKIVTSEPTQFGTWLYLLQGQRAATKSALVLDCLSRLDLTGQSLGAR